MGMILTPRLDQESIGTVCLLTRATQKICFCFGSIMLVAFHDRKRSLKHFIYIPSLIFRQYVHDTPG